MKHRLPRGIKILVSLLFICAILLLPHLFRPHFIFLGIFFIESAEAALIYSLLMVATLMLIYFVLKLFRKSYYYVLSLYSILGTNAAVNLIASIFFGEDIQGFISKIFGSPEFYSAYIINQSILLLICLLIVLYAWANRPKFVRG